MNTRTLCERCVNRIIEVISLKLRGTITEQSYRNELLKSNDYILHDPKGTRLRSVLNSTFEDFKTAYILGWIPEESEDIYTVLVNGSLVVFIELDRIDTTIEPIVSTISVKEYIKGMSKMHQIKLAVAIALSEKQ